MSKIPRKSDGRRIFTDAFKRKQIDRVESGELTMAELGRKLGIARSLLQRWRRGLIERAGDGHLPGWRRQPTDKPGAAQYIRELQLLVGKQSVELELLRIELDALRNNPRARSPRRR